ncbi:ZYRO0C05676p [Zygosaccharomyces rouxii]|uniref:ZYRO0C05676p n=1 Tax=Zygosaccharomyces rouxii (strain ATCC 2623 / CBS 732 / NBRC 1130 / NCYC 568 / NRRL Y-229) TaxID=559307 RepID=C5DT58_ZYGRC|nr:uncharacterized protein ZYRO0C05676g [Zygosaccharomyces rouxii]KAH9201845.1 hypothetical protein LQ764DRAFT_88517 [Zygosaccharomyces rouxii]CAR26969.1 ZYRO0C05676p [Zygosaccharomyces rouxii]
MNHSKIPSISTSGANLSIKRRRLSSSPMLQDVTNHVYTRPSIRHVSEGHSQQQNRRLLNKYIYGDATVIEEVKKRERKIIKDINHFRNAILEIEKESAQIRERQLPDIQYAISKRITMCSELQKELSQQVSQLDLKEGEIEMLRRNEEMNISNLHLKWSVELQELETQLRKEQDDRRLKWEKQLLQLENLKPDEKIEQEIRQLKTEMAQVEEKWQELRKQNQDRCNEYSKELDQELEKFKSLKAGPMDELIKEQTELKNKKQDLDSQHQSLVQKMETCDKDCRELEDGVVQIEQKILEIEEHNKPLKEEVDTLLIEYELEDRKTQDVQELAHREEKFYNSKFDKMEQEQLRRRKLENSIDEMKGQIRRFAYVTGEFQDCEVDYAKRCVDDTYSFNRIVPSILMDEKEMLFQEYEMYHDMCLGRGINFNLISVSSKPWTSLRFALLNFLCDKCLPHYHIDLQYVFLSEEMPSQDMLSQDASKDDKEIELKIEKDSIEIDSCVIRIKNGAEDLPSSILQETPRVSSGIGVVKFQLTPMVGDSKLEGKPIDFYFLEVCDSRMISILDNVVSPGQTMKSPISLIFKKLLLDTKSCLWFNLNDKYNYRSLLDLSNRISKMKNLKNGRRSI